MNYCSEILLVPSSSNAKSLQLSGSMCLTRMAVGKALGVRVPRSGSHPQPQTHWAARGEARLSSEPQQPSAQGGGAWPP